MPSFEFTLPKRDDLTSQQRLAIDSIEPVLVTGCPGSGKTVVSIYRFLKLNDSGKEVMFFTYTKLLRAAIQNQLSEQSACHKITTIEKWYYSKFKKLSFKISDEEISSDLKSLTHQFDEIIIDEAQDLKLVFFENIHRISDDVSLGADDAQQLYSGTTTDEMYEHIENIEQRELTVNYRNTFPIFNFARQFIPYDLTAHDERMLNRLKLERNEGDLPFISIYNTKEELKELIKSIIDGYAGNIGILLFRQADVDEVFDLIKEYITEDVSKYHNNMNDQEAKAMLSNLSNILVTTLNSAKGMEFDIVVMPKFGSATHNPHNLYYVGATRAKRNLFILCENSIPKILNDFRKDTYEEVDLE